jgi:hypothetical protein
MVDGCLLDLGWEKIRIPDSQHCKLSSVSSACSTIVFLCKHWQMGIVQCRILVLFILSYVIACFLFSLLFLPTRNIHAMANEQQNLLYPFG